MNENQLMREAENYQPANLPHLMATINAKRDLVNDDLPFTSRCFVLTVPFLAMILSAILLVLAIT